MFVIRSFYGFRLLFIDSSSIFFTDDQLFLAGADCFRLNFSHGSQEQKLELLMTIREIEEKYSHPIGILGDLQGPKLRVRTAACFCVVVVVVVVVILPTVRKVDDSCGSAVFASAFQATR